MKKAFVRAAAMLTAAAVLIICASCGRNTTNEFNDGGASAPNGANQIVTEETGAGFSHSHAVEAGFGMGSDTPDDITARFGAANYQSYDEYTSVTVASLEYDFGYFEFEGAPGSAPVLTYLRINSTINPPCGCSFSQNIEQAANTIYSGSGEGLISAAESQIYFYGDASANSEYGRYTMLTIEFISSTTNDTYALEYRANAYEAGKMTSLCIYFDPDYAMTGYELRYA